jgi:ribose transport system ATP-binding protein
MSDDIVLRIRGLSKSFGPVKALTNVDFDLRRGEIHALAGENGAGKSTLMNIIDGIFRPDSGEIQIDGRPVTLSSPAQAQALGIGFVHQEIALCPDISVAENIMMAATARSPAFLMDFRAIRVKAEAAMAQLTPVPVAAMVGSLPISQQQLVEIGKALTLDCHILILDEPTASLTERETVALFAIMRRLKSQGISMIYISHRMAEIFGNCDRVTVLRDGRYVGTEDVASTTPDRVVARMVGRELGALYPPKLAGPPGPDILTVDNMSGDRFRDVSLRVRRGEILGMAGLVGAGRSEIVKAACGLYPRSAGVLSLLGEDFPVGSYRDAVDKGVVYLSENRKTEGVFLDLSIAANISALDVGRVATRFGFLDRRKEDSIASGLARRVSLKIERLSNSVSTLSGGNQQKVAIAKMLSISPRLIFLDEPTRGVDVGAKFEIHRILRGLAEDGVGIVAISSEFPELIGLCDRVLVVHEGRIAGEVAGDALNEQNLIRLASGIAGPARQAA